MQIKTLFNKFKNAIYEFRYKCIHKSCNTPLINNNSIQNKTPEISLNQALKLYTPDNFIPQLNKSSK